MPSLVSDGLQETEQIGHMKCDHVVKVKMRTFFHPQQGEPTSCGQVPNSWVRPG